MSPDVALQPAPHENRTFTVAISLSILAHIIILLVHFGPPDPSKIFNRDALEVILVNAHADRAAEHPDALAQYNLDGGGNTDQANRHIQTPLPAQDVNTPDQDIALKSQQISAEEERQRQLLTQLKTTTKVNADASHQLQQQPMQGADSPSQQQQNTDISRLEGEIAQDMSALQSRPHKAFVGARTKSQVTAFYVDKWRQKVERVGTEHYPAKPNGEHLRGDLFVTVELRRDGTVSDVKIERPSGNPALDEAAIRIVKESGPFDPIPAGVVDYRGFPADYISISRHFTFTNTGTQVTEIPAENH